MKAIFIFCEGPHDISFLKVVLGLDKENFKIYKNKLSKYPTPLDEFYKMRLNEYTSLDLRFDEPIYPLLPSLTFTNKNEDTFLIFYNTGGKDKYDKKEKTMRASKKQRKRSRIKKKATEVR